MPLQKSLPVWHILFQGGMVDGSDILPDADLTLLRLLPYLANRPCITLAGNYGLRFLVVSSIPFYGLAQSRLG